MKNEVSSDFARDDASRTPIRVLFLCTGNSARSQIAEALLRQKGGNRFVVASAGTDPANAVRPGALDALAAAGIDWSHARTTHIDTVIDDDWDMIITLCDRARESCPTLPTRPVTAHWGIPDPAQIGENSRGKSPYADTFALLAWRIDLMLALRPELLDKLVLEERLQALATKHPPTRPAASSGTE